MAPISQIRNIAIQIAIPKQPFRPLVLPISQFGFIQGKTEVAQDWRGHTFTSRHLSVCVGGGVVLATFLWIWNSLCGRRYGSEHYTTTLNSETDLFIYSFPLRNHKTP